jgi:hypothetical protein
MPDDICQNKAVMHSGLRRFARRDQTSCDAAVCIAKYDSS